MKQTSNIVFDRKETVRGFVVPKEWDSQFQVTEVLIACEGERELRIDNLEHFPNILSLSQEEALITGTIKKNETGESIFIESFDVLNK